MRAHLEGYEMARCRDEMRGGEIGVLWPPTTHAGPQSDKEHGTVYVNSE